MRILVIGGGGHIGSFLVPRLVRAGHRVTTITRGSGARYTDGPEWREITRVIADAGRWGISTPPSGPGWPPRHRCRFPTGEPRCSTTSTPTTWPRPSRGRWTDGPGSSVPTSTSSPGRR
ncbi:NAD-dependent epimerase/dehydratase family protein [Acidipropionibacterium jensenii]|uniref:NAD-dependent epimerase/dehydratase family protein n=1 Tax=Acidipropionibacterium jensenii TaxID=1749 RepID=UPI0018D54DDB